MNWVDIVWGCYCFAYIFALLKEQLKCCWGVKVSKPFHFWSVYFLNPAGALADSLRFPTPKSKHRIRIYLLMSSTFIFSWAQKVYSVSQFHTGLSCKGSVKLNKHYIWHLYVGLSSFGWRSWMYSKNGRDIRLLFTKCADTGCQKKDTVSLGIGDLSAKPKQFLVLWRNG